MPVRFAKNDVNQMLHSTENPDAKVSFVVMIPQTALPAFKKVNIDKPATFYKGKTTQVTGLVETGPRHMRIVVSDPKDIKVIAD
jgi:hypothetical protein